MKGMKVFCRTGGPLFVMSAEAETSLTLDRSEIHLNPAQSAVLVLHLKFQI
jgi:hypothetical protein